MTIIFTVLSWIIFGILGSVIFLFSIHNNSEYKNVTNGEIVLSVVCALTLGWFWLIGSSLIAILEFIIYKFQTNKWWNKKVL